MDRNRLKKAFGRFCAERTAVSFGTGTSGCVIIDENNLEDSGFFSALPKKKLTFTVEIPFFDMDIEAVEGLFAKAAAASAEGSSVAFIYADGGAAFSDDMGELKSCFGELALMSLAEKYSFLIYENEYWEDNIFFSVAVYKPLDKNV